MASSASFGEVIVRFGSDTSGFSKGIDAMKRQARGFESDMSSTTGKVSGGFGGMLKSALAFAGGQAIFTAVGASVGFLKDQLGGCLQESMDAQAGLALTTAVLKSTGDASGMTASAVVDLAGSLSHLTTFSDDTVQAAENMLLTFTNIGQNVFPQATKTVLDMSQALGQDTKSSAIQLGKALNDPIAGITALSRVGVTFTQKQKDTIKSLMDTNHIAGAQGIILKELQREFGGAAQAAGKTFGGQMIIAQQRLADVKQTIGDALLPILTGLMSAINARVMPALERFGGFVATSLIPAFDRFSKTAGPLLLSIFQHIGTFIHDTVVPAFQRVGEAIGKVINYMQSANFQQFLGDIGAVGAAFLQLLAPLKGVQGPLGDIAENFFPALGTVMKDVVIPALDLLVLGLAGFLRALKDGNPWAQALVDILTGLGVAFASVKIGAFLATIPALVAGFLTWATTATAAAVATLAAIWPILALAAAVAGVILIIQHWGDIMDWVAGKMEDMRLKSEIAHQQMQVQALQKTEAQQQGVVANLQKERDGVLAQLKGMTDGSAKTREQMKLDTLTRSIDQANGSIAQAEREKNERLKKIKELADRDIEARKAWNVRMDDAFNAWVGDQMGKLNAWTGGWTSALGAWRHNTDTNFTQMVGSWASALGAWRHNTDTNFTQMVGSWMSGMGTWVHTSLSWVGQLKDQSLAKLGQMKDGFLQTFATIRDGVGGVMRAMANNALHPLNGMLDRLRSFLKFFADAINNVANAVGAGHPIGAVTIGNVPYLAGGTDNFAGGPAIVGEQGRELVMLPRGTSVLPHEETEQVLRGQMPGHAIPGFAAGIGDLLSWFTQGGVGSVLSHLFDAKLTFTGAMSKMADGLMKMIETWGLDKIGTMLTTYLTQMTQLAGMAGGDFGLPGVNLGQFMLPQVNAMFHAAMAYGVHQGIDLNYGQGTPLRELIGGTVLANTGFKAWGGELDVQLPTGMWERYLHLSRIDASAGEQLTRGQGIGLSGGGTPQSGLGMWSSGAHLHVQYDGGNINAGLDPLGVWASYGLTQPFNFNTALAQSVGHASAGETSGGLAGWITQAIGLTGVPPSWLSSLETIAMKESGGNPSAVNRSDSNAQAGHPSQGLMQTIASTFAAYAVAGHGNILNPVDNAAAAIRYIQARYGSVFNVPGIAAMASGRPYVGYANGGLISEEIRGVGASGQRYLFGENGPERVTPARAETHDALTVNLNVDGRTLAQAMGPFLSNELRINLGVSR